MWQLSDTHILTETESGFMVCLLAGSWSQVEEIKPIAPKHMSFKRQAELLREALAFAENLWVEDVQGEVAGVLNTTRYSINIPSLATVDVIEMSECPQWA